MASLTGAAFDRAFIDDQVATHVRVLDELDTLLIPAAHDVALSAVLKQTRDHVAEHLRAARQIQTTLNR